MIFMNHNAFSVSGDRLEAPLETASNAWRTLPLDGHFDLVYEDATGAWSNRSLEARELKLGPGRTLLGGIDARRGGYRGFRVDRIRRLTDGATGERIETGILDRLLGRAEAQRRADALRIRRQARARRRAVLAGPA
jgi:predicted DNA-binding transcriptional regulator YafY